MRYKATNSYTATMSLHMIVRVGRRLFLSMCLITLTTSLLRSQQDSHSPPSFTRLFPGVCADPVGQYARVKDTWKRGVDTTVYHAGKDTMLALSRQFVQRCGETFGAKSERSWEQLDLGRMQLAFGDDSGATITVDRYLDGIKAAPPSERAWALVLSVADYLSASPARMANAERRIVQLDSLGREAIGYRFQARLMLANAAQYGFDEAFAEQILDTIIWQWRRLPADGRTAIASVAGRAYMAKAEIAQRTRSILEAQRIMDTAKAIIPEGDFRTRILEPALKAYAELLGTPAPPIDVQWWFGRAARTASSRPRKGVVTVVQFGLSPGLPLAMSRWTQRFGDQIEFITLEYTQGWMRDTAPVLPKDEAENIYAEHQRRFQLPGLVGIYETEYDWLKDGRRVNRPFLPNVLRYSHLQIIDRKGIVRYVYVPGLNSERIGDWTYEDLIARKIAQLIAEGDS